MSGPYFLVGPVENFFAVIAVVFGLSLAFLTAPFQSPDEPAHFLRIWQLSQAQLAADNYGGTVPVSLGECFNQFNAIRFNPKCKTTASDIWREFGRPLAPHHCYHALFPNTSIYSPVAYLPQAIACFLGRVISLPPIALMYLGRCANVLAYTAIGWLTIHTLPILKWPALLVLTSPAPLFLAGSLSADSMTIALTFLATAAILRVIASPSPAPRRYVALVAVALLGTALCKWTYFTVVLLLAVVRLPSWGRWRLAVPLAIAVCAMMAIAIWSHASVPMHVPLRNGDPGPQSKWLETHPLEFMRVFFRTIRIQGLSLAWESIGVLGWLDIYLWSKFVMAYMAITAWAAVNDEGEIRLSLTVRLVAGVAVLTSVWLIALCSYLVWNYTANPIIEGLQGRYFVPLALMVLMVIRGKGKWEIHPVFLRGWVLFSCVYTVLAVVLRYY